MKNMKLIVLVFILLMTLTPFPFAMAWELERPGGFIPIEEREMNATTDGKASVGLGVHIHTYYENDGMFDYRDAVGLRIVATANSRRILEYGYGYGYYCWHDTFIGEEVCRVGKQHELRYISFVSNRISV